MGDAPLVLALPRPLVAEVLDPTPVDAETTASITRPLASDERIPQSLLVGLHSSSSQFGALSASTMRATISYRPPTECRDFTFAVSSSRVIGVDRGGRSCRPWGSRS